MSGGHYFPTINRVAMDIMRATDAARGCAPTVWPVDRGEYEVIVHEADAMEKSGYLIGGVLAAPDVGQTNILIAGVPVVVRP